jgi:1-deoxy-D-xylulose-5-phosphate reductoisomerase
VKAIAILGSTGSIGRSALAVVDAHPDRLRVVGLAAGGNTHLFIEQVRRYRPAVAALATEAGAAEVKGAVPGAPDLAEVGFGSEGLIRVATSPEVDLVLCATSGTAALAAVLAAIEAGKTIALANKEVLVMAGRIMIEAARRRGVRILPVDSEHNAILQCLEGRPASEIRRLILTASGGPFRDWSEGRLEDVSPGEALRHPTWSMGPKITIDSATLMNKGLEVIEARWLFETPAARIDVLIHPQSVVHSLVELRDGSVLAQLGVTDMRLPIQYAFSYPDRWDAPVPSLDLTRYGRLEFMTPDLARFPCLRLAYDALRGAPSLPVVLNAANEVAVAAFLEGAIGFTDIPRVIEQALEAPEASRELETLEAVTAVDKWTRAHAAGLVRQVARLGWDPDAGYNQGNRNQGP